jgi:hypothetical protein
MCCEQARRGRRGGLYIEALDRVQSGGPVAGKATGHRCAYR